MTTSARSTAPLVAALALALALALAFVALAHEARAGRAAVDAGSHTAYAPGPGDIELVWGTGEAPRYVAVDLEESSPAAYTPRPGDVELVWGTGEAPRYVPVG